MKQFKAIDKRGLGLAATGRAPEKGGTCPPAFSAEDRPPVFRIFISPRARRRGEGPSVPLTPGSQRKEDSLEDVSPPETVAAAAFKYGGHGDASSGPPGADEETEDVVPHAVGPVVGRGAKQPQGVPRTGAPLQMRVSGSTYSSDCALSKLCPQGLHDEEARRRVPAASVATAVVGD